MNEGFPAIKSIKKPQNTNVLEVTKKFLRVGLVSVLLTYGSLGEASGQHAEGGTAKEPGENNRGNISSTVSTETPSILVNKESPPVNSEIIRSYVFSDKNEKSFLSKKNEDSYFLLNNIEDNGDNINIPFKEIEKFCNEIKTKDVTVGHTHPLAIYRGVGYDAEDIKKMQTAELGSSPMPPSILDFQGITQIFSLIEEKGIKINGKVFDATGVWEYKISEKNIDLFNKYKQLIKKIPEMSAKVNESFSGEEKEILQKYRKGIHPEKLLQTLKQNPETSALGEKLEKVGRAEVEKISQEYKQVLEGVYRVNEISIIISNYARESSDYKNTQSLDDLIEKYKQEATKLGFDIEYTPYQK